MFEIKNQNKTELFPYYIPKSKGDFELINYIKMAITEPIFKPLIKGMPLTIKKDNVDQSQEDIIDMLLLCLGDNIDIDSEKNMKEFFSETLINFKKDTNLTIDNLFAIQSAIKQNLPEPDYNVIYTANQDIIPVCKNFIRGIDTYDTLFVSFAFYTRSNTLSFYFLNEEEFNKFKEWANMSMQALTNNIPSQTSLLWQDFYNNVTLDGLTEGVTLRKKGKGLVDIDEYSFPRVIMELLMQYTKITPGNKYGIMPFSLEELFYPTTILFINIEKHSKSNGKTINDEWNDIKQALSLKLNIMSKNKISKLTKVKRNLNRIKSAKDATNKSETVRHAENIPKFKNAPPTQKEFANILNKIINRMGNVNKSLNPFKVQKTSFQKPNRRNPDDFNKPGKINSFIYKPDIHIYLDTSGSISEENYQNTIVLLIKLAKKLNIDLYFNSFSHVLSEQSKLSIKDKTAPAIYKEFAKIPKVGGGTDYKQIWEYIEKSPKRRKELSIIITDFEYLAPRNYVKHPDNLYYMPISETDWRMITDFATEFVKSMKHIDSKCRNHLIM